MIYIELNIPITSAEEAEILTAELAEYPFESFTTDRTTLKAYMPHEELPEWKEEVDELLERYEISGARYISIEDQNWNALWESNFERVEVARRLLIRAPFHEADPSFEMEVVIMPKMSFGTGHHSTTHLMSEAILDMDLSGKRGLDMGSGTGLLAIIAAKCGAEAVDAIDIDEWADENCRENISTNHLEGRINPMLGDASLLAGRKYDFILANINRNILLKDMPSYAAALNPGGSLTISGFLKEDIEMLTARAAELGLSHAATREREGWIALELKG
ncbi:MAG: 50S ribosomal protein L11 methyltransferase [Rikenellaceae bacterium]